MTKVAPERTAIVTGGSRGIGLGIARMLAQRGWGLTLTARGAEALDAAAADLRQSAAATVETVAGDMGETAHVDALLERHLAVHGSLDALVLAAGVGSAAPLAGYPDRRLDRQIEVNFRSPFRLISAALPHLRDASAARSGSVSRVIAIASLEGIFPEPGLAAYGASKAALISLMASINAEERLHRVVATAIAPGYVDTAMSDWVADQIPKATMLQVSDVVRAVEFVIDLSSEAVVPSIILQRRTAQSYEA